MPIQEVVKRHPLTSTKVHHRAKNKQFSTLRCTKTGSTQPKLSAACFVVQSCLADADFVVFSNYCLIGTRPKTVFLRQKTAVRHTSSERGFACGRGLPLHALCRAPSRRPYIIDNHKSPIFGTTPAACVPQGSFRFLIAKTRHALRKFNRRALSVRILR